MDISQIIHIEKNNKIQLDNVKINLIKMISNRGFILPENIEKYTKKLLKNNDINETEFIISLDNDTNYNTTIKNKTIHVRIYDTKIISMGPKTQFRQFI